MTFEEALSSVSLTPEKIGIVIQTHLHFNHCYNTRKCVNAKVVVQEDELKFAFSPSPFGGFYGKELFEGLNF
jgi:N-acyl homoserine lactone hydrolase